MNDCKGLFGKWFGHCFVSYPIKKAIRENNSTTNFQGSSEDIKFYLDSKMDHYCVICKRCGEKKDVRD